LSELAWRSKAYWGYDRRFLEACRTGLTLTPAFVRAAEVYVLDLDGRIIGFYSLARWNSSSGLEVRHLFVEPAMIGRGVGRRMWRHAVARAASLGCERLVVQSDPNAVGFYLKQGAERIGDVPSAVHVGRTLPLLLYGCRRRTDISRAEAVDP
jgi:GNAT superfamily N-acetyltransferase